MASKEARPWTNGEISTLIYGVMRLGEAEFSDLMNQTMFLKREHELKTAEGNVDYHLKIAIPEKGSRTTSEVAKKWEEIKLLRSMDIDRLRRASDAKLMT